LKIGWETVSTRVVAMMMVLRPFMMARKVSIGRSFQYYSIARRVPPEFRPEMMVVFVIPTTTTTTSSSGGSIRMVGIPYRPYRGEGVGRVAVVVGGGGICSMLIVVDVVAGVVAVKRRQLLHGSGIIQVMEGTRVATNMSRPHLIMDPITGDKPLPAKKAPHHSAIGR
jgi:hypothetical protein